MTDDAGNTGTGTTGTLDADNEIPNVTVPGIITISTDNNSDGIAAIDDVITYALGTETTGDTVTWRTNLSAYGLSANFAPGAVTIIEGDDEGAFVANETITDNAGNTQAGAPTAVTTGFNIDNQRPTVTVNQETGQDDPTYNNPVYFTVVFSEPINTGTFTTGDLTLTGSAGVDSVSITEVAPNDGTTFEVAVDLDDFGDITASIGAGRVADVAGNTNLASTSTDNEITYENKRAKIYSWKAYQYEKPNSQCIQRIKLEINGKYFDKDAEVKIGGSKASSVDRKSSKKIVAKFCLTKLLNKKVGPERSVSVTNPSTERKKASKKINLLNYPITR